MRLRPATRTPGVAVLLLAILVAAGCGQGGPSGPSAPKKAPVPVEVARAEEAAVPVEVRAVGTGEPLQSVAVRSRVEGTLLSIHFKEGQDVVESELLFQLDPRPLEAALRRAEADLAQGRVQAKYAAQEAARYAELVQKGYVTREQYDQMQTQAESARAAAASQQAAVENARLQLGYTTIRAPLGGRTGSLQVKVGDLIPANGSTPMVTINQIRPILVAFSVPQEHLAEIQEYRRRAPLKVEAPLGAASEKPRQGTLVFMDNTVDPATGTVLLKAEFPNRDEVFWPGQFVEVALVLYTREHAVVVPSQAVETGQQGTYLFVVGADGKARTRTVKLGPTWSGKVVIDQGVDAGETVVTEGQVRLTDGKPVEIQSRPPGGTP